MKPGDISITSTSTGPASTTSSSPHRRHGLSPRQRRLLQAAARARSQAAGSARTSPHSKESPPSPCSPSSISTPVSLTSALSPIERTTPSPTSSKMPQDEFQPGQKQQHLSKQQSCSDSVVDGATISASGSGASTAVTDATTASFGDGIRRLKLDAGDSNVIESMRGKVSDRVRRFSGNVQYSPTTDVSYQSSPRKLSSLEAEQVSNDGSDSRSNGPLHQQIFGNEYERQHDYIPQKFRSAISPRNEIHIHSYQTMNSLSQSANNFPQQKLSGRECQDSTDTANSRGTQSERKLRYYRITFKGVVSLLPVLDTGQENPETTQQSRGMVTYLGYGEIVATSAPEIEIQMSGEDTKQTATDSTMKAIRVEAILTGGHTDDSSVQLSHEKNSAASDASSDVCSDKCSNKGSENFGTDANGHGFLLLCDQSGTTIAEPMLLAGGKCPSYENGSFVYRVRASSPVKVLSGPYIDAPSMRCALLPGTIHKVSLRISVPIPNEINESDDDEVLVDDGDAGEIQFLRLGERRWVADRRIDAVNGDSKRLRVSYLMQEITDESALNQNILRQSPGVSLMSPSFSFDDSTSLNSSVVHSTTDSSHYSSINASSVMTPTAVKAQRRRNVRRKRGTGAMGPSSMQHPLREHPRSSVGGSFEESCSSITGGGGTTVFIGDVSLTGTESVHDAGTDSSYIHHTPNKHVESFYLMRVIAPMGLKILDAPHFQVSNLINSPSPGNSHHRNAHSPPTISPFARTNAAILENSPSMAGKNRNVPRVRFIARGQFFEASSRMESAGADSLYTNCQGLIKLADGSGWAIVPNKEDLVAQFDTSSEEVTDGNEVTAYEEIGNSTIIRETATTRYHNTPTERLHQSETSSLGEIVWLRVLSPNGVRVLLPPPQPDNFSSKKSEAKTPPKHRDSEISSTVSNSFFDSMWSKVTPTKQKEKEPQTTGSNGQSQQNAPDHFQRRSDPRKVAPPVIPCGMVVPVEPWENCPHTASQSKKSFVRLCNGQGWIPQCLGKMYYTCEVDTPDIRHGSFWFRVQSISGVDVRHGPSPMAPKIKSDVGATFRFECGEFLRASEIITVFDKKGASDPNNPIVTAECFAKLYRNHRSNPLKSSQNCLDHYSSLSSLTFPGEWVQVYGNGDLFLEECSMAPTIERFRGGWKYSVVHNLGTPVRCGPSFQADLKGKLLNAGDIVFVTERVVPAGDDVTWFRLKDGEGWINSTEENGEVVIQACASSQQTANDGVEYSQRMVHRILNKGQTAYSTK